MRGKTPHLVYEHNLTIPAEPDDRFCSLRSLMLGAAPLTTPPKTKAKATWVHIGNSVKRNPAEYGIVEQHSKALAHLGNTWVNQSVVK